MAVTGSSTFGRLLHAYRIELGLTQEELADRSELSVRTISDLERGVHHYPQLHTVQRLAEALDLDRDRRAALQAAARRPEISTELPAESASRERAENTGSLTRPPRGLAIHHPPGYAMLARSSLIAAVLLAALLAILVRGDVLDRSAPAALAGSGQNAFVPWGPAAGAVAPFVLPYGVAVDRAGNIYVADSSSNRVTKLSPSGQPLMQWGGRRAGSLSGPTGVAVDLQGNVYVADTGNDRVLKLAPDGSMTVVWERDLVPRTGLVPKFPLFRPLGVAVDAHGNVYVANTGGNDVEDVTAGGTGSTGIPGGVAGLNAPSSIAVNGRGDIYVADTLDNRLHIFSSTFTPVAQWGGLGTESGGFGSPAGVAVDREGNVYVADSANSRIQKLSSTGKPLAQYGGVGSEPGRFREPTGVAVDGAGNIYVADSGNARIQKLSPTGRPLAQWTAAGMLPPVSFNSPSALAVDAQDNVYVLTGASTSEIDKVSSGKQLLSRWQVARRGSPVAMAGIAVDGQGRMYAVDELNNQVVRLTPQGRLDARWGNGKNGLTLDAPSGVAVDRGGNVYVADSGNKRIVKLSADGRPLAQFGSYGFGPGQFNWPRGISLDARGNLYVADSQLNRVQEFSPQGRYLNGWGVRGSAPGQLNGPVSVAGASDGSLYVADEGNNRVQRLSADGKPLGIWWAGGALPGHFADPVSVAVDRQGNIYVADRGNNRIQRLSFRR